MNGCERYELLASLAVDEEATLEEQAELESHLESCPSCRAYFEDIKRLHEILTPEKIVLPEDFHTRVMDRVRQTEQDMPEDGKTKKTVPFPHWRRWAALAACCAIAVLSVWGVRSGNGDAPAGGVPQAADVRSMPQDAGVQAEDTEAVEDEISVLSEAAPPPLPEEYEDLVKSAAKEGLSEGTYQPPVDDTDDARQKESGSLGMMPAAQDVPEPASNAGEEDMPAYEDGQEEPLTGPADEAAVPVPVLTDGDGAAAADRENKPEAPMPAPETEAEPEEAEPEEPETVSELEPVEVVNAPEEGVLIAFAGGAAQIWVENVLGLEWAGGGSYTLSMEQYRDLLEVLQEAGEPYGIKPGEGYCLMTE